MAVIKNINKGVYKRKLHKRYSIDDLENELKRWYESSKGAQDRMASWTDESNKIKKVFNEIRINEEAEFRRSMNQRMEEFSRRQNVTPEQAKQFQEEMTKLDDDYNKKRSDDQTAFDNKMKEYENKVRAEVNGQNNHSNTSNLTPLINGNNNNNAGNNNAGNNNAGNNNAGNNDVFGDPLSTTLNNPTSHIEPTSSNTTIGKGNGINHSNNSNRDTSISDSIDNVNNEIIANGDPQKNQNSNTLPLLFIIIVAIVVGASAAVFVIRRRKKAREFNDFDLKPNYESNEVQVVTEDQRVITESVINDYANDYPQSEGQEQNINVNGENSTNVEQVGDQVSDQSFPVSPISGKELTIDDFIPLMKYK